MTDRTLGERIAEARRDKGLSQKELAALLNRSESWVSQVERDVLPVERLALLQRLAEVLEVGFLDLRPEIEPTYPTPVDQDLERLRHTLVGHPALSRLFVDSTTPANLDELTNEAQTAWAAAMNTNFGPLADVLPKLEDAVRVAGARERRKYLAVLARTYQSASAGFARQQEGDAALVAADRAITAAEASGDPLAVAAGHFRLAHTLIRLRRNDDAKELAEQTIAQLQPLADGDSSTSELLSLYGAMHLIRAVLAGYDGDRTTAQRHLDDAEAIADRLEPDRNDYDTEFNAINVQLHRIALAIELGDAGHALEVADRVDPSPLSPERRMRYHIDRARAFSQRRQADEAVAELEQAETVAPENFRSHQTAIQTLEQLTSLATGQAKHRLTALSKRTVSRA